MNNNGYLEQLKNIFDVGPVWDGNLISKYHRDELVKNGLVERANGGFNLITIKGVNYLHDLGLTKEKSK